MSELVPEPRISDADRDHQIARLRQGTADGRLTLDEFADRVSQVYASTTRSELERVTSDLPDIVAESPLPERKWVVGTLSGARQSGRWRPAKPTYAVAVFGGVTVDLNDALIDNGAEVVATAFCGGIEIVVPPGVHVDLGGFAVMGNKSYRVRESSLQAGAPVVRVRARAFMGGVTVRTKRVSRRPR